MPTFVTTTDGIRTDWKAFWPAPKTSENSGPGPAHAAVAAARKTRPNAQIDADFVLTNGSFRPAWQLHFSQSTQKGGHPN